LKGRLSVGLVRLRDALVAEVVEFGVIARHEVAGDGQDRLLAATPTLAPEEWGMEVALFLGRRPRYMERSVVLNEGAN
jgi:hypothetical protein